MTDHDTRPADQLKPAEESPETLAALSQFASLLNKTGAAGNPAGEAGIELTPEARAALTELAKRIKDQSPARENTEETKTGKPDR